MVSRRQGAFDGLKNLIISLDARSRNQFRANGDAACSSKITGDFEALDGYLLIGAGEEPIGTDQGVVISVCGVDGDVATGQRCHAQDVDGHVIELVSHGDSGGC